MDTLTFIYIFTILVFTVLFKFVIYDNKLAFNLDKFSIPLVYSTNLLLFIIPFHRVSTSLASIFLFISIFIFLSQAKNRELLLLQIKLNKGLYLLFLFWFSFILIHFVIKGGNANKISLFILPLFYLISIQSTLSLSIKLNQKLTQFFIWGTIIAIPIVFTLALQNFDTLSWKSFYYTDLLDNIKGNTIVFSLLYNVAILFAAYKIMNSKNKIHSLLYTIAILFYCIYILFIGSKIGYFTTILTLAFIFSQSKLSLKIKLLSLILLSVILFITYLKVPYVNKRINGFKWQLERHKKITMNNKLPRSIIWPQAVEIIKESPLIGNGIDQTYNKLEEKYIKIGYSKGVTNKFNAHNQFLDGWIQFGITSIIWLITFFTYLVLLGFRNRNYFLVFHIILLISYCCIESLFASQLGIIVCFVFIPIFLNFHYFKKDLITP